MAAPSAPRVAGWIIPSPRRIASLPLAWRVTVVTLPLLLLLAMGGWLVLRAGMLTVAPGARIGEPAPSFALADLDGATVRLADLAGRPLIVNFWASWCVPCVEEFPLLEEAQRAHGAEGLTVVGIVVNDRAAAAQAFIDQMGASWTAALDPGGEVARAYGIYGTPETFFIRRDGIVDGHQIGQLSAADLDRQLAQILEEDR